MLLKYLIRKFRFLYTSKNIYNKSKDNPVKPDDKYAENISENLQESLQNLKNSLSNAKDLKVNSFRFGLNNNLSGALVFIDGLVDNATLIEAILRPIKNWNIKDENLTQKNNLLDILEKEVLCASFVNQTHIASELVSGCLSGDTVLLADGCSGGLVINSKGWEKRAVTEPQSEAVVRGPREGFTENLLTNTSLIRRKIRNSQLKVEQLIVGRKTQTNVRLMYLEDIADPKVVEKVKYRIGNLDVESILEAGYIEEYIEDAPFSPFATIGYSEKPDVIAGKMLEGRVAILVDGTPFVLTAPMLFIETFQNAEDYYSRPLYASFVRIIRFIAFIISIFAPAIYIAMTDFHQEMIPSTLLFTIAKAREGIPFSTFAEAFIMVFAFEILREAGVRLPRAMGQAINIVGALVMGDAAVNAGIVGAPMVIVIAITAVAGFLIPIQNDSSAILRIPMMVVAAFVGFYGVAFGFLAMLVHLATLESFGVPYFDSFSHKYDIQDTLVRMPLWSMIKRPENIAHGNTTRGHLFIPPLRPHAMDDDQEGG